VRLLIGMLAVGLSFATGAVAEPDFRGKTVTVLVSFEAGGGYDIYGRLLAHHWSRHLPGQPTVIVQNMPGAGGLVGTNYLYNVAPKDGTVVGLIPQTVAIGQLLGTSGNKYDARRFAWVGRVNSNVEVEHSWTASGVTDIADAKKREVIVAGTGPASSSVVFPRLMNALIGTRFKIVPGYEGANSAVMALERGEIEAMVRPWAAIKATSQKWLSEGKISLLVQYTVGRHPDLPNVPAVVDLAETPEQRQIFTLYASGGDIGRSLAAPPGLTAELVDLLRSSFMATMKDAALLQEAEKANVDLDPLDGVALQKIVDSTFDVSPDTLARAKELTLVK
jgi:tripartite-type tricarboxylate transporter receptor subunit TctC